MRHTKCYRNNRNYCIAVLTHMWHTCFGTNYSITLLGCMSHYCAHLKEGVARPAHCHCNAQALPHLDCLHCCMKKIADDALLENKTTGLLANTKHELCITFKGSTLCRGLSSHPGCIAAPELPASSLAHSPAPPPPRPAAPE